jgi:hypothetical protein
LKMVDLPTFGRPTIPHLNPIKNLSAKEDSRGGCPGYRYDSIRLR